ncbi:hypothetical protein H0H93_003001, partial [Arthromyces matolae]
NNKPRKKIVMYPRKSDGYIYFDDHADELRRNGIKWRRDGSIDVLGGSGWLPAYLLYSSLLGLRIEPPSRRAYTFFFKAPQVTELVGYAEEYIAFYGPDS